MKHYRLLGILLLLENHGMMTAKALAEHFEVSVRTIYRDLDCLSEAGYSILTESGKGGGITLAHSKRLRVHAMEEQELLSLIDKLTFNEGRGPTDQNMLLKIRGQLPRESQAVFDKLSSSLLVDTRNWFGVEQGPSEAVATLQRAITHSEKMAIGYTNQAKISGCRTVWPMGLVKKSGQHYLVAFCEGRMSLRTFKVSKITSLEATGQYFEYPGDFDIKVYWEESLTNFSGPQISSSLATEGHKSNSGQFAQVLDADRMLFPVVLSLVPDGIRGLQSEAVEQDRLRQLLNGFKQVALARGHLQVDLLSEETAIGQLLRLGHLVRVEAPESLRAAFLGRVKAILTANA